MSLIAITIALAAAPLAGALHFLALHVDSIALWLEQNPQIDTGLALWVVLSLANKLQSDPKTAGNPFTRGLRTIADVLSFLPHADAKGVIGGALSKYMQPGFVQNILQMLFGWYNLPVVTSTPNPGTSAADAKAAANAATRTAGVAVLALFLVSASACAFLQKAKAGEINCLQLLETDEGAAGGPEITLILSSAGADWAALLAQQEVIIGKDLVWCSVENAANVLAGNIPGAPLPDGGVTGPILPNGVDAGTALAAMPSTKRALISPPAASTVEARATALSRARTYLAAKH